MKAVIRASQRLALSEAVGCVDTIINEPLNCVSGNVQVRDGLTLGGCISVCVCVGGDNVECVWKRDSGPRVSRADQHFLSEGESQQTSTNNPLIDRQGEREKQMERKLESNVWRR